jgi:hypothetical protein
MRLFFSLIALASFSSYAQTPIDSVLVKTDTIFIKKDSVSIIGVGDIMMGTNYPEDKLPTDDGAFLMKDVETILQDADVTFGNLEGTLLDSGGVAKKCNDPRVCYAFRTPVRYVKNLEKAGFDMMSLANNHAGDMGEVGQQTAACMTLDSSRNSSCRTDHSHKTTIFEKDSIRYGLAAFAPNTNCVSINDLEGAKAIVRRAGFDSWILSLCHFMVALKGAQHTSTFQEKHELYLW